MSNMTLKDWRELPARLAITEHSRRHRRGSEKWMLFATFLSALATFFAGGVALMQYKTMEAALIAPNRNSSFYDVITSIDAICVPLRTTPFMFVLTEGNKDKLLKKYYKNAKKVQAALSDELLLTAESKLRAHRIWESSKSSTLNIQRALLQPFKALHATTWANPPSEPDQLIQWHKLMTAAYGVCQNDVDALVARFKAGKDVGSYSYDSQDD